MNTATSEVRRAKAQFENSIADEVKDNAKHFWRYVKSQTKTKMRLSDLQTQNGSWAKTDPGEGKYPQFYF